MGAEDSGKRTVMVRRGGVGTVRLREYQYQVDDHWSWRVDHWRTLGKFRCMELIRLIRPYRDVPCNKRFTTERQVKAHIDEDHPYFHYHPGLKVEECTCAICGYFPSRGVDNPRAALRSHERKMHKIYARPYVIHEEP